MWQELTDAGTIFRRGQLVLVCAPPGIGKSALTLNYALLSRVASLYFSADSDAFTQLTRSIAVTSRVSLEDATQSVLADRINEYADELNRVPIRLNYSASPSLADIETGMAAYDEVYGDYPSLVVADNASNIRLDPTEGGDGDTGGMEAMMEYLHTMARETQACVFALHHVTGPYNSGTKPIPLDGIKGQIGRVPEVVLTLHKVPGEYGMPDKLAVSTVKNRGGKADPSGETFVELEFEGDTMRIGEAA
ncbi:DnaB-like helicase C-terminal domain-containing protein [Nocardia salmonicida]|uniref:DnaB-like helicase C-terminal domain-containing protein n=1 Tax=Nocardia salmonicida TaxID=53431 RepID=UPI003407052A